MGPALGEGTVKRVGMATGLGRERGELCSWAGLPTVALQPVSLEPSEGQGGGTVGTRGLGVCAGGNHCLCGPRALTFPCWTFEWYGGVAASRLLCSACQPPGYRGEGLQAEQGGGMGRNATPNPQLPGLSSPPLSLGPSPSGFSLSLPENHIPFERVCLQK